MASSSSFPLQIFTSVNDVEELESFSIPKLVTYLKTSSRTECFKTVENILISREEKLKFEKEEVMKVVEGLEKELRAYEDSCLKWSMGVGKLESEKSEIESDFKEEVQRHEEDFNVYRERERRAIERIRNLSSELQNVTREKNKEIIELKTKNKEVEYKKRKVEDERDMLKRRLVGMVKRVTNLENECAKLTLQFEAMEDSEKEETYGEENRSFYTAGGDSVRRSLAERSGSGQAEDPPTLASQRSTYENVVVITDSESENEATHAEKLPKKCVIKTSFSQKDIENGNSHKEKYPSVSSRKRRRMVLSSDSEDDDRIPIGNLEMKKLEEVHHHSDSFGNQKFMASTVSYGIDKSRNAGKIPMKPFETDGTFLSGIQSWKANGLKWHYEVDMLTSFEKDPRVCMRAICALYRQHILEKKAVAASGHSPNRGFCRVDEQRATFLVEFLLDGNLDGEMKKSVEELKRYSPSGIDDCVRLAKKYTKQLFTIYKNKEDPFFC